MTTRTDPPSASRTTLTVEPKPHTSPALCVSAWNSAFRHCSRERSGRSEPHGKTPQRRGVHEIPLRAAGCHTHLSPLLRVAIPSCRIVPPVGIEPTTHRVRVGCSAGLSYRGMERAFDPVSPPEWLLASATELLLSAVTPDPYPPRALWFGKSRQGSVADLHCGVLCASPAPQSVLGVSTGLAAVSTEGTLQVRSRLSQRCRSRHLRLRRSCYTGRSSIMVGWLTK